MKTSEVKIQVRYAETDMMGVVYHANYLVWCEVARTKYISELGLDYRDIEKMGYLAPITGASLSYKAPAKYGDEITVRIWVEEYTGLRFVYNYEVILPNGEIACTAQTTGVVVHGETFRPISMRRVFPEWHEAYENAKKK